ncbi:hypothetical protein H0194_00360 [Corynebacterium incognita]|uniref:YtpA n=1 Tax=Corynebacterium incognita TaxID=2754725 RepID=A0A7G7CPQ0_9CORY|nr:hypothetical protein [Corynebacterium incognita]QNE89566.1 hypothetical protein H0194_00360 [Corynebacterium incognita]
MSIRAEFQPTVDEFISNLESFATGSYLKEDEKEFWDQPFDPAVLPELRDIVEKLLDTLDALPDDPEGDALAAAITPRYEEIAAFNRKHHDAVVEPEEKAELAEIVYNAAAATGADDEALAQLPDLD